MSRRIEFIKNEIIDQYLNDENEKRPWIIGFSGGKDSTAMLQMVWYALREIPKEKRTREIYVICNDTLVENPIISSYVNGVLEKIRDAALKQDLPIFAQTTTPKLEDSFWVNLIGRGYPTPNSLFRWCTERLKIEPTTNFILNKLGENGEAIILLGTRYDESANRSKSIQKHDIKGKRLSKHQLPNVYVYAPIKELMIEEIWGYINTVSSPWFASNKELYTIYADASSDDYECPTVVVNKNSPSCGQSRFGCWVCTVVKEDKSMTALIENGYEWLRPLLEYRNNLYENRNIPENREKKRKNGDDSPGPYTPEYRKTLLEDLLKAQIEIQKKHSDIQLISNQELIAIQILWHRQNIFTVSVAKIFGLLSEAFNEDMKNKEAQLAQEKNLLTKAFQSNVPKVELVEQLLELNKSKQLLQKKRGLPAEIENHLEQYINKQKTPQLI